MAGDDGLEWLSDYLVSALKSPTWVVPIAEFVDERCHIFDDAEENKFEYTICHNEFRRLIEDLFIVHLLDVSVTEEQFRAFAQHGLSSKEALHHILCEQLLSVDDFLVFKSMMVRRNAELDHKAALALSAEIAGRSLNEGLGLLAAGAPEAVSLHHDSGTVGFATWPMTNGVLAWHDRDFVYSGIPDELAGATLFAGPHKDMPAGVLIFATSVAATLYILYESSGGKRDGGFAGRLKLLPEWIKVGGTQMKWGTCKGKDFWVTVWSRKVAAGASIDIPMEAPFVGGVAVQADSGEWRLYEQQEQDLKGVSSTGKEEGASAAELQTAAELAREADQRREKAELEQAIALSLAAEEERLRQLEVAPVVAAVETTPAAAVSTSDLPAAPIAAPPAEVPAPAPVPTPSPEAVEASRQEEPIPDAPTTLHAPKELNPVMPRMVHLKPIVGAPAVASLAPISADPALHQLRADAIQRRERAQRAIEAPSSSSATADVPAPTSYEAPVAPAAPTEEERRLRAEHLKRQRALLMQKRKEEREQQLQAFHASRGTASAVDRATGFAGGGGAPTLPGGAANFTPGPDVSAVPPDSARKAQEMRQALTLQLRQTLTSSAATDTLGEKVEQLEQMKSR